MRILGFQVTGHEEKSTSRRSHQRSHHNSGPQVGKKGGGWQERGGAGKEKDRFHWVKVSFKKARPERGDKENPSLLKRSVLLNAGCARRGRKRSGGEWGGVPQFGGK